jgi:heterodisulfide reductase subunit A
VDELEALVRADPLITILAGVAVEKVEGFVGNFTVRLEGREPVTAGALVLATGFELYQPANGELGWGNERVVTLTALLHALPSLPRTRTVF